jgi:hypothetical protein
MGRLRPPPLLLLERRANALEANGDYRPMTLTLALTILAAVAAVVFVLDASMPPKR